MAMRLDPKIYAQTKRQTLRRPPYGKGVRLPEDVVELPPKGAVPVQSGHHRWNKGWPASASHCGTTLPKWRNWQTRRTQNPVAFTGRVGSSPTFGIESNSEILVKSVARRLDFRGCSLDTSAHCWGMSVAFLVS